MKIFQRNINMMFHATSTPQQYKEIVIAILLLDSYNMGRGIRFFLHAGRSNPSIIKLNTNMEQF